MVKVRIWAPGTFATRRVKVNRPDVVGVPEIVPAVACKLKPGGKNPLWIVHTIGESPVA